MVEIASSLSNTLKKHKSKSEAAKEEEGGRNKSHVKTEASAKGVFSQICSYLIDKSILFSKII